MTLLIATETNRREFENVSLPEILISTKIFVLIVHETIGIEINQNPFIFHPNWQIDETNSSSASSYVAKWRTLFNSRLSEESRTDTEKDIRIKDLFTKFIGLTRGTGESFQLNEISKGK